MVKKGSLEKTLKTTGKVKRQDQTAVSEKTCFVESPKHEEEIKKTILKWRDIKVQKQRQNVRTKLHNKEFIDLVHKETLFEEKHSRGLSEKASPRKTSKVDEEEGKKTSLERKKEIQKQREIARLQIDQMKDSAGFNDNMEAQVTFSRLIRGYVN